MSEIIHLEDVINKRREAEKEEVVKTELGFLDKIKESLNTFIEAPVEGIDPILSATGSYGNDERTINVVVHIFYALNENGEKISFEEYLELNNSYPLSFNKRFKDYAEASIVNKHAFGVFLKELINNNLISMSLVNFAVDIDEMIYNTCKDPQIYPLKYVHNGYLMVGLVYALETNYKSTVMLKLTMFSDKQVKE